MSQLFKKAWEEINKKTITLEHIGYVCGGTAYLTLWGGGNGSIEMDEWRIMKEKLSNSDIATGINDGQFGCVSIDKAEVYIYELYNGGHKEYLKTITFTGKQIPMNAKRGI